MSVSFHGPVRTIFSWSCADCALHRQGNAYGLANTLLQTAVFRPPLRSPRLANLYFAGQLTVPGPGMPPAIIRRAHTHTHIHPRGSAAFLVSSPSLSPSPAVACWWLWSLAPPRSPAMLLDNHGSAYFRVSISESCGIYASSHGIFRVIRPAVSRSGPRIAAMPREHVSRSRQDGRVEASIIGSSQPPGPGGESRPLDGPDKARRARQGLDPAGRAASTGSRHPKTPGRVC